MKQQNEIADKAYQIWLRNYAYRATDQEIFPFTTLTQKIGWLQKIRRALFISNNEMASRLNICRQSYLQLEKNEEHKTISIKSLERAAEAMNCELIYAIVPKSRLLPSQEVWRALRLVSADHPWTITRNDKRRPYAMAAIATQMMENPRFRQKQKWSKRKISTDSITAGKDDIPYQDLELQARNRHARHKH
jgi:transcriptional regulator with XRE-family HTH domain